MAATGSYDIFNFAVDTEREIRRLNAQVDLFWNQEFALHQRLGLADGMCVLDCGCGPGYVVEKLRKAYPSLECTGIDIEPELVATARKNLAGLERCTILQQSITSLELPDDSFDFVISRLVLEHVPDPMAALREVLRVLKKGGKAVFIDNDFDWHERTWPNSPALEELYGAYRNARRSEGGNPCIGRELPLLMKQAGYGAVDLCLLAAHNHVIGDEAFLRAEGSGIPMRLVRSGFLSADSLDRIAGQWRSMLKSPSHAIFRMLFAAFGVKEANGPTPALQPLLRREPAGAPRPSGTGCAQIPSELAQPQSVEEMSRFIQEALANEMNTDPALLTSDQPLMQLGVDSLSALGLCHRLENRFNVTFTMVEVLSAKSIGALAEQVMSVTVASVIKVPPPEFGLTTMSRDV